MILSRKLDSLFRSAGYLFESKLNRRLKVISSRRASLPSAASSATTTAATEKVAEDIVHIEHAEDVVDIHVRVIAHADTTQTVMTVLVVTLAFIGIAQHLVGFGAFLELILSLFVVGILIGVVLHSHTPIRTLYIVGGRVAFNP